MVIAGADRCTTTSFRSPVCQVSSLLHRRGLISEKAKNHAKREKQENMKIAYYAAAVAMTVFGVSYASVPLYKAFCQVTGFGGTTQVADDKKAKSIKPVEGGEILKVYFMANVHSEMPWTFKPTQNEVRVVPGETALAFYTVKNPTDHPIMGVATYNVFPPKAGLYFNKIQCFCFEEQRLGPHEEIDMPVFFFIDPEMTEDPAMENVRNITLSYTFFKTGEELPEDKAASATTAEKEEEKATALTKHS